ncbi:EVE domain-containing protein [Crenalkalicoccus roseus]|uniref:EVE domain-containing protein n=1 Tax=Crenalkalicoccus roseus TaxID=1485588 RepID=UPI001080C80B|nr:EVE domain-containing protein [Crenalkalicoccus roseus]
MRFWLVKSEPEAFSWEEQVRNGTEPWTGVRNAQAAGHLKAMRLGDRAFFYHSNTGREIVGVVEVAREAYPDPTDPSGRWVAVDLRTLGPMPRPVPLAAMKAAPELAGLALIRQPRLSVMPVDAAQWDILCRMGGWEGG